MFATSTALVPPSPQALTARSTPGAVTAPSTRTAKTTDTKASEAKPSPGTFRHPQLTEIIRRQSKATLTENNIRASVINAVTLTLSLAFSHQIHKYLNLVLSFTNFDPTSGITSSILVALHLLFVIVLIANIIFSLRPILPYTKPATYDEIPLTPSQRKLLGLPPSSKDTPASTATPGTSNSATSFITPPRYTRRLSSSASASPSTDRRSISANYSSSPLSTSRYTLGFSPTPTPSMSTYRRTASGSPFSPSGSLAGSPLFHKAVHNRERSIPDLSFDVSSRTSLSSSLNGSSLARSQSVKERGSPARRRDDGGGEQREKRSPVQKGVNYKWLYDKGFGGGLSRSESMGF